MNNQEIFEQILNKKFQKSVFTGYQTEDVDKFFDYVIEYLKQNELDVQSYKKIADALQKENAQLKQSLHNCENKIVELNNKVKQYEDDGYINVSINKQKNEIDKKEKK